MAVIIAAGMWVYAASSETSIAKFPTPIPIKVINLSPNLVAVYDQKKVKIEIATESVNLKKISAQSFSAYIDLEGLTVGTHEVSLSVTTQLSGVSIISKDPSMLIVTVEPSMEKDVSVVEKIDGNAAENMVVGNVVFSPATVKVSGPKSIVEGVSQAMAEIVLSGESESFSKSVELVIFDNKNQPIEYTTILPASVAVEINIVRAGNVKNVGIKVVTSGTPASGYYVSSVATTPAIISVIGTAESLHLITSIPTQAIDLANSSKTISAQARLAVPIGVRIDGSLSTVSVTISLSSQSISKTISVAVKTKNIPNGLVVTSINPQTLEAVVSGSAKAINSLTQNSILLFCDLAGSVTGSKNLSISADNFSLPDGISLISFLPMSITIVLE